MCIADPVEPLDPMYPFTQYYDLANYNIDTFIKIRSENVSYTTLLVTVSYLHVADCVQSYFCALLNKEALLSPRDGTLHWRG